MKKRNWTLLCLIGGIVCFGLFGVYNLIAKGQETFELEDISGDRAFLADFPLEGYAGDHVNRLEFTIVDGKLDVKHHPYSTDVLANIRLGREAGRNPLGAYFSPTQNREFYSAETEAVPTEKAKLEREKVSNVQRFSEYLEEYQYGETITADRTDIYLEVSGFSGGKRKTARFPSGLTLTEPILFTYGSVAQNDNGNMFDRNSYKDGFVGEEYGIRTLRSCAAKLGDSIYAVVAPDERCEGTTYIYRVETKKRETDRIPDWTWENEIMDRSTWGEAEPFLPVPDPAKRRIVGMEGIDDTYLVVFLTEGAGFYCRGL